MIKKIRPSAPGRNVDNPFAPFILRDLSHRLHENVPTWKGSCGFSCDVKVDYEDGLRAQSLRLHAGVGTHMDAPSHFIKGAPNIADIPLGELIAPMVVLHVNSHQEGDFALSPQDIRDFEREHGPIAAGTFVAVNTHWADFWDVSERYRNVQEDGAMHFPHISSDAAEMLLDRDIVGVGIDTLSPDPEVTLSKTPFPVHHCILGAGKYIVENMANLGKMPPRCHVMILPIPIAGATESPVRAVALLRREG